MKSSLDALQPYLHLLQTEKAQRSLFLVDGFALGLALNEVSRADLTNAIGTAAENTGIPTFALSKHAESLISAFRAYQANRKTRPH